MREFIRKYYRKARYLLLVLGFALVAFVSYAFVDKDFKLVRSLDIFYTLFRELNMYYVDETDSEKLIKDGITGMLENLDPYTVFIDEEQLDDYDFMTTGKYGGIGAIVRKSGNSIIIVEPYENSPAYNAGLKAGDIVHEVDGKAIDGTKLDDVSELLKGDPGTKLELLIERSGKDKWFKKTIKRDRISINSVSYSGLLSSGVAYLKLNSFTDGAHLEVKNVLLDLKAKGATSLIIDLRENPGGLLNEAVDIVNLFVGKGVEIVSTRGKLSQYNSNYKTSSEPVDTKIPLIVLVNKGSASASEIVAGSLQDLDRAVIVGQRTFGKGLVQTTRPLSYNTKLKITTAKYYIPSGRCIQALDYTHRRADGSVGKVPDSLKKEFKTLNGRKVYDGGGVMPDIYLTVQPYSKICYALYSGYYLFDFATIYAQKHDSISSPERFALSDADYAEFEQFLKQRKFDYSTNSEDALKKLIATVQKEKYAEGAKSELEALTEKLMHNKKADLQKYRLQIAELLGEEIVSRYYFQKGRVRFAIVDDPSVKKALDILSDTKTYTGVLKGEIKQDKVVEIIEDENDIMDIE